MKPRTRISAIVATLTIAGALLWLGWNSLPSQSSKTRAEPSPPPVKAPRGSSPISQTQTICVDDFEPQPYQGDAAYYYNRVGGDRGTLNDSSLDWGKGQVTATVASGRTWSGLWMSLNHPDHEGQAVNFAAVLPLQILPAYQSQVTGLTVQLARGTSGRTLKLDLKDRGALRWSRQASLDGGAQTLSYDLPSLTDITTLALVLDNAVPGDSIVVDRISLTATTQITDVAQAAFVWSYGMLLENWNPETGLVRDKARDASGQFDAIQATGALAAATALAEQLQVIDQAGAVQIVDTISHTLLISTPRYGGDRGLWPHWVQVLPSGILTIVYGTEWSSVDTAIAAISLLDAQHALGLDTAGTEQMLRRVDWASLLAEDGISHGYTYARERISSSWDTFGGESWLVALAYAAATGEVAPIAYPTPPTANGAGFIDELTWLLVLPPSVPDRWDVDWASYRISAADTQAGYYPTAEPASCLSQGGLFGLSPGEVPAPSAVDKGSIYQAFGVGGRFSLPNDGTALLGTPVMLPHYAGMVAALRPQEVIHLWAWLIDQGPFSPLNNVESLTFPSGTSCDATEVRWNHLRGSWNLSLQTLGWGNYLAGRQAHVPAPWQATLANAFLRAGYLRLVPRGLSAVHLPVVLQDELAAGFR